MRRPPLRRIARVVRGSYPIFARWYFSASVHASIHIREVPTSTGASTVITVNHRFPFGSRAARFLVTTSHQYLSRQEFGDRANELNAAARPGVMETEPNRRGRVLYLVDLRSPTQEVLAAVSLHISEVGKPLLVRCIALREDGGGARGQSIIAALVLKVHAHEISYRLGRRGLLDAEPGPDERWVFQRLGFTRVSDPRPGVVRVRQEPYPHA